MTDPVDPDELESTEFSAVRRGIDPAEVRSALARAADGLRLWQRRCHELEHQIEALEQQIPDDEHLATLQEQARAEGRAAGEAEGEQRVAAARDEAEALVEAAKVEGRQLVSEAKTVRRRMLEDLARRRRTLRVQVEQLRGGRERLLEAYEVVGHTMRDATEELSAALPEARAAAERAGHRIGPEESVGDLEAEIEAGRLAGLPIVAADPGSDDEDDGGGGGGDESSERRRPEPVPLERDVRDMREVEPVVADFEQVRLIEDGDVDEPSTDTESVGDSASPADESDEIGDDHMVDEPPISDDGSDPRATSDATDEPDAAGPGDVRDDVGAAGAELDSVPATTEQAGDQAATEGATATDTGDDDGRPDDADGDLFSRLRRARRPEEVEPAQGDDPSDSADTDPDADEPTEPVAEAEQPGDTDAASPSGGAADPALVALLDRDFDHPDDAEEPFGLALGADADDAPPDDGARTTAEHELARRLKRLLSDEQNDVLDRLRTTRKKSLQVVDLLDDLDDRVARFAEAVQPVLDDAARAELGEGAEDVTDLAAELAREVGEALADGLIEPLEEEVAVEDMAGPVRSLYREWKTDRIGRLAERYVEAACEPVPT